MKLKPPHECTEEERDDEWHRLAHYIGAHNLTVCGDKVAELAAVVLRLQAFIEDEAGEPLQRIVDNAVSDDGRTTGIAAIKLGWPYDTESHS